MHQNMKVVGIKYVSGQYFGEGPHFYHLLLPPGCLQRKEGSNISRILWMLNQVLRAGFFVSNGIIKNLTQTPFSPQGANQIPPLAYYRISQF